MDGHFHTDSFARTKVGCQRLKYITAKKVATNRCKLAVIFFCCKLKKCCNELSQQVLIQQCAVIFSLRKVFYCNEHHLLQQLFSLLKMLCFIMIFFPTKGKKFGFLIVIFFPAKKKKFDFLRYFG